jgi:class 3 adenylate cyclase
MGNKRAADRHLKKTQSEAKLERDIVIARAAGIWHRVISCSGSGFRRRGASLISSRASDELHVCRVDLQGVSRLSVAVSPLFHPQAAFDVHRFAPRKVLRCSLRLSPPERHTKPGGNIIVLAGVAVFSSLVSGQTEAANRRALRRIAQLRIATEVADQGNFVERHLRPPVVIVR